ncbi:hypothetical protein DFH01_00255 [Falsiroseomonas bella]|uniref:Uncharacterized protein n=1 Tax=Falsiroseomonas bella TaxID=2184016 RepID=A0A317FIK6_9PROT|nr:hypothetical protein [Falsiroseomonas bella]PWS37789.1 hypothetical protein DFH01_00255 [Falsiroseomonas bella]
MSVDPPPGLDRDGMAEWRAAFHARRAAIVADCQTWQERALRLYAAGETSRGLIEALGLEVQGETDAPCLARKQGASP